MISSARAVAWRRDFFTMRYTHPWFFCPSKRVAQTPGAARHRPPNGAHADAFSHCSRADSRPDRVGSGHSQVAQDLADIRTRGERLQLSVRATPTAGAGDRSNGASGLLVEAAAAPPHVSWTPAAAATARLDRFDRQMIIATHLAHRSDVVRRAKHCCAQRSEDVSRNGPTDRPTLARRGARLRVGTARPTDSI